MTNRASGNQSNVVRAPLYATLFATLGIVACSGSSGTGGASGGANQPGTGGATNAGSGGSQASGGSNASGGASASGGSSASGGAIGSGGATKSGGATGSGGTVATGGTTTSSGGATNTGGRAAGGNTGTGGSSATGGFTGSAGATGERFSFFVTSVAAMRSLSKSQNGFGGDLRFGETGAGAGLRGADKICATVADMSMPGASAKGWRAFLSATTDGAGSGAVNAADRVGAGPWYDRKGRLVAMNRAGLVMVRPAGDAAVKDDLPNESGLPNHADGAPGCTGDACPDNHDTLTGTSSTGTLLAGGMTATCNDWTSAVGSTGKPGLGHSWTASSGMNWMQVHAAAGCAPGVNLVQAGGPPAGDTTVGGGGGYGGIYCFALMP